MARTIYTGMRHVITAGTARHMPVPTGHEVAAKTGTAETRDHGGQIDSWLVATLDRTHTLAIAIHRAPTDIAAITAGSQILTALAQLPTTPTTPTTCPTSTGGNPS